MMLAFILALLALGPHSWADEPPAALEIQGPVKAKKAGPIPIEISLTNRGSQPLWVNKRLSFISDFELPPYQELTLRVRDPDGRRMRIQGKRCGFDRGSPSDFAVLAPGDSRRTSLDIARYYRFKKRGVYSVQIRYENGSEMPPTPEGATPFSGPLTSNELKIRLVR